MATIVLDIASIPGNYAVGDYTNKVAAVGISSGIAMALSTSTGSTPTTTSAGKGAHSDICLTRFRDDVSPKFARNCAAGTGIGDVDIILLKDEDGLKEYLKIALVDTYVSRYETSTQDTQGREFAPHMTLEDTQPPSNWGGVGLLPAVLRRQSAEYRPMVRSIIGGPIVSARDNETERLWLNATSVTWTFTPYVNGAAQPVMEKGFNILTGAEIA